MRGFRRSIDIWIIAYREEYYSFKGKKTKSTYRHIGQTRFYLAIHITPIITTEACPLEFLR